MSIISISGNKYILIMYDEDYNYNDVIPISSRTEHQILIVYKSSHAILKSRGLQPHLQQLENEVTTILKNSSTKKT